MEVDFEKRECRKRGKEIPLDPWGTEYVYRAPGRSGGFEIVSYGSDGLEGGSEDAADIESWRG